ncbi:MAG: transglycosylase domain-containing protein, partial [Acidimicrobiia bacterium]
MVRDRLIRLALVVVASSLFVAAAVTAMAPRAWGIVTAHEQRPVDLTAFSGLAQRSTVVDVLGRQIGVYQLENSQPLDIDEVPEEVLSAFLAVEDAGFYAHRGTNLRAFARALLSNASGTGRQGASTITMQVVKNEFLGDLPRDARYK